MKIFDPTKCSSGASGGLPDGGNEDDLLLKDSSVNGDATWHDALPASRVKELTASKALVSSAGGVLTASSIGSTDIAQKSLKLDQFAATTAAELRGVIDGDTGTGDLVFGTSPALSNPTGLDKNDVGLDNVDNTSDATKNSAGAVLTNKTLVTESTTFESSSGTDRQLDFTLSGGTDSTKTTIVASQTANRTLTLPDSTDTLVGVSTSADLLNKTLTSPTLVTPALGTPASGDLSSCTGYDSADLDGNVPVNKGGTNSSTALSNDRIMVSSSDAIVEAAAITASKALVSDSNGIPEASSVTDTELGYVSGVTGGIQGQLDAKAATSGKLSQFAATTSAELAGVISDETGSGALVFGTSPTLITPALGIPASGDLSNCTGYDSADLEGAVPVSLGGTGNTTAAAAFSALSPLTTKGDILGFSTTDARLGVGADGQVLTADTAEATGLKWAKPAGGGGGKNYVLNPDAAEGVTDVTNVCTGAGAWSVAEITTASELPEPSVGTGFKISGTNVAVNDTVKWDILTTNIDDADGGRMGTAEMYVKDISGTISGDYKMQVYNVTTSSYVGDSVDIDGTGYFFVDVPLIGENDYQVHLIALVTSPTNIGISGVSLGPVSNSKSAVVTAWKTYTPSSTPGFGTITSRLQWRQVGENIEVQGNIATSNPSTTTTDEARIELPNSYTVDWKTPTTNIFIGDMIKSSGLATFRRYYALAQDGQTYVKFGKVIDGSSANPLSALAGNSLLEAGYEYTIQFSVPVVELKNSTTLDISDVQFANSRFSATQLTSKGTSNGVITDIDTWTSSTVEGGGSFNGTAYTIPADGWYEVRAMIRWANATFGSDPSDIYVYKNTTAVNISYDSHDGSANNPSQSTTYVGKFAKDDTVKIACKQNSGTIGLGTTAGEALFSVVRVSDTSARNAGVSLATTTVPGLLEYKVIETTDDATYSPHSAYQKLATHTLTKGTWEVCSTVLINAGISSAVTMYAVISPNASSPSTSTSPYPSLQGKQFGASVSTPTTTITVTAATENWYLYFWAGDTSDADQCKYHFHCRKIAD